MAHATFVARMTDGLVLVETPDYVGKIPLQRKMLAEQFLRNLCNMPPRGSVEGVGEFAFH